MKKENFFKQIIAIVIIVLLICSLSVSADKTEMKTKKQKNISNDGERETLIWDNYMGYNTNHPSFYDDTIIDIPHNNPIICKFCKRAGWKDTILVRPSETLRIIVRFEYLGLYMYQCHILEHEDAGMMGQFEVRINNTMDFELGEEQIMLKTFARDFLEKECPKKLVREMMEDERGYSTELWKKMADLGWMALIFPEKYGGEGSTFVDLAVLL